MPTNPDDWTQLPASIGSMIGNASITEGLLLTLAGISAGLALGIGLFVFVVAPLRALSDGIRAGFAWLARRDWRWVPKTLWVIAAVVAASAVGFVAVVAVFRGDPIAELVILIVGALALVIVPVVFVAWLLGRARQAAGRRRRGDSDSAGSPDG